MTRLEAGSADELQRALARLLLAAPEVSPRGERTRELLHAQLLLSDPRRRELASPARRFSLGFAAGEFLWYWRGARDVASLEWYNRRTPRFSDDGVTLAGAYGPRIRGVLCVDRRGSPLQTDWSFRSQWELTRGELLRDPDSRRAVLAVYSAEDAARAARGTRDVPCTLSLQFLLRGEPRRLHLVATMRSCDAVWGLANDLHAFTLLQEAMAVELSEAGLACDLGTYAHQAASLHAYERHFDLLEEVAAETCEPAPACPPLGRAGDLGLLLEDEEDLRLGRPARAPRYGGEALRLREALETHRDKRAAEAAQAASRREADLAACK